MESANQRSEKAHRRHAEELAALLQAVLESPAETDRATRAAAYQSDELSPPLRKYVAKVRGESYRITDEDIQMLLRAGYSQDAVFEITVASALGAAMRRLEASLGGRRAELCDSTYFSTGIVEQTGWLFASCAHLPDPSPMM